MLHKNILKFNDYTIHSSEKQEYQCKNISFYDAIDPSIIIIYYLFISKFIYLFILIFLYF